MFFAARQKRNLSQAELADLSGVPKLEVRRLELGMVVPTTRTLIDLVEALGVELRFVLLSEDAAAEPNRDVVTLIVAEG